MTTAWILPGGSSMGAIQVGQAEALLAAGAAPDLVVGTSAGSLNAAYLAGDLSTAGLSALRRHWLDVRRRDVFPLHPLTALGGLVGRRDHLVSHDALAAWMEAHVGYRLIEAAGVPLVVTATDLDAGESVYLRRGPLVPALMASCALPGIYPPVRIDGRRLVDGSVLADVPIDAALSAGADRIYVLVTVAEGATRPARSPGAVLMRAVDIALGAASTARLAACCGRAEVYLVPAPPFPAQSPFRLGNARALMDGGRAVTEEWLPSARPLAPAR